MRNQHHDHEDAGNHRDEPAPIPGADGICACCAQAAACYHHAERGFVCTSCLGAGSGAGAAPQTSAPPPSTSPPASAAPSSSLPSPSTRPTQAPPSARLIIVPIAGNITIKHAPTMNPDYATQVADAAGAGLSGAEACAHASHSPGHVQVLQQAQCEPTLEESLEAMAGATETVNEDLLIQTVRYLAQFAPPQAIERAGRILNGEVPDEEVPKGQPPRS